MLWGPGLGDSDSQTGRYAVKPGGDVLDRRQGHAGRGEGRGARSRPTTGDSTTPASTTITSWRSAVKPGAAQGRPISRSRFRRPPTRRIRRATWWRTALEPVQPDQPLTFYVGPKDFDTLVGDRSASWSRRSISACSLICRAAAAIAELDPRVRRQLRLVDRRPDGRRSTWCCFR